MSFWPCRLCVDELIGACMKEHSVTVLPLICVVEILILQFSHFFMDLKNTLNKAIQSMYHPALALDRNWNLMNQMNRPLAPQLLTALLWQAADWYFVLVLMVCTKSLTDESATTTKTVMTHSLISWLSSFSPFLSIAWNSLSLALFTVTSLQ